MVFEERLHPRGGDGKFAHGGGGGLRADIAKVKVKSRRRNGAAVEETAAKPAGRHPSGKEAAERYLDGAGSRSDLVAALPGAGRDRDNAIRTLTRAAQDGNGGWGTSEPERAKRARHALRELGVDAPTGMRHPTESVRSNSGPVGTEAGWSSHDGAMTRRIGGQVYTIKAKGGQYQVTAAGGKHVGFGRTPEQAQQMAARHGGLGAEGASRPAAPAAPATGTEAGWAEHGGGEATRRIGGQVYTIKAKGGQYQVTAAGGKHVGFGRTASEARKLAEAHAGRGGR